MADCSLSATTAEVVEFIRSDVLQTCCGNVSSVFQRSTHQIGASATTTLYNSTEPPILHSYSL